KHVPATVEQIVDEYEAPLMERLREPRPSIAGARELLDELRSRGLPIGLCTASYARWTQAILAAAELPDEFDAKVTGDVIERAKPDPEPYLLAASMIGVPAQECLVVEDSVSGITSALAAGTVVVQLRAT